MHEDSEDPLLQNLRSLVDYQGDAERLGAVLADIGHSLVWPREEALKGLADEAARLSREIKLGSETRGAMLAVDEILHALLGHLVHARSRQEVSARIRTDVGTSILHHLSFGPLSNSDLCEKLQRDPGQISRRLAGLRENGLVESVQGSTADRRIKVNALTATGHDAVMSSLLYAPLVEPDERVAPATAPDHAPTNDRIADINEAEEQLQRALGEPVPPARSRSHRSSKGVLQLDPNANTVFVVPTLTDMSRRAVPIEHVLALAALGKVVASARPPRSMELTIATADTFSPAARQNVIALCSVRRNPFVAALLAHEAIHRVVDLDFVARRTALGGERWSIRFDGATIESPSYEEEAVSGDEIARAESDVELHDYAVVARFTNPWDANADSEGAAKCIVVAGIRAFGTLGAADFLRREAEELFDAAGGADFACVLRVTRSKDEVSAELTGHLLTFPRSTANFVRHGENESSGALSDARTS
jgi:DNA-binding MarR family transcriptional regulator